MTQEETLAIVNRIQNGDENAFTEFYTSHYKSVYSIAFRIMIESRREDIEEAVNDAFMMTWKKLRQNKFTPKPGVSFRSWFYTLSRNVIYDKVRKENRLKRSLVKSYDQTFVTNVFNQNFLAIDDSDTDDAYHNITDGRIRPIDQPDNVSIQNEHLTLLETALNKMSKPHHRIAFILVHLEGYKTSKAASILNTREGTIKIWIFRAKQALKLIFEDDGITFEDI